MAAPNAKAPFGNLVLYSRAEESKEILNLHEPHIELLKCLPARAFDANASYF